MPSDSLHGDGKVGMDAPPPRVVRFLWDVGSFVEEDEETEVGLFVRTGFGAKFREDEGMGVHTATTYLPCSSTQKE